MSTDRVTPKEFAVMAAMPYTTAVYWFRSGRLKGACKSKEDGTWTVSLVEAERVVAARREELAVEYSAWQGEDAVTLAEYELAAEQRAEAIVALTAALATLKNGPKIPATFALQHVRDALRPLMLVLQPIAASGEVQDFAAMLRHGFRRMAANASRQSGGDDFTDMP